MSGGKLSIRVCRRLRHIQRYGVMLGQGSNQLAMDHMVAGDAAQAMDVVDETMRDQSFSVGAAALQAQCMDYERSLAIKSSGCYCGAPYAENGICTAGEECPRHKLGRGHWHSALRQLEQMSEVERGERYPHLKFEALRRHCMSNWQNNPLSRWVCSDINTDMLMRHNGPYLQGQGISVEAINLFRLFE